MKVIDEQNSSHVLVLFLKYAPYNFTSEMWVWNGRILLPIHLYEKIGSIIGFSGLEMVDRRTHHVINRNYWMFSQFHVSSGTFKTQNSRNLIQSIACRTLHCRHILHFLQHLLMHPCFRSEKW